MTDPSPRKSSAARDRDRLADNPDRGDGLNPPNHHVAGDELREDEREYLFNAEGTGQTLRCQCGHLRALHNNDTDWGIECFVGECKDEYGKGCN